MPSLREMGRIGQDLQEPTRRVECRVWKRGAPSGCLQQRGPSMTTFRIGHFVGNLSSTSADLLSMKVLVQFASKGFEWLDLSHQGPSPLQRRYDTRCQWRAGLQSGRCRCGPVRHARLQPLDPPGVSRTPLTGPAGSVGITPSRARLRGIIGTSPGSIGTAVAPRRLRGVLCLCNSPRMNTPGLITLAVESPLRRRRSSCATT